MNNLYIVIPARSGSKGLPFKNRRLFKYTEELIKSHKDIFQNVILTSDDEEIIDKSISNGWDTFEREAELSNDTASMKDVLLDVIEKRDLKEDDVILMLYLTYPERRLSDIERAFTEFKGQKSLLCKMEPVTHPCLCIYEDGSQVIFHNLCRRQEYPKVYEVSHYIFLAEVGEIKNLNRNLYNGSTKFMWIERTLDVDEQKDFDRITK
jgi:CMP-N-acetylneuraminic acid synthetase